MCVDVRIRRDEESQMERRKTGFAGLLSGSHKLFCCSLFVIAVNGLIFVCVSTLRAPHGKAAWHQITFLVVGRTDLRSRCFSSEPVKFKATE